MPTTRKRHQQQQRAQQQQQQQQQQLLQQDQQQSQPSHDKQNNNNNLDTGGGIYLPQQQNQHSQQPNSKAPNTRAKAAKDNVRSTNEQDDKSAVQKDIQAMLESDLYCAICREIYIDPLILNCAHSFCKFCLNHWLSKQVGCPSCRMVVVFQTENLALKDIVNKMIKTSSPEFQQERTLSLDQRSKAELQQKARGVKPMMEKKSFSSSGRARRIYRSNFIRSWRAPNGATIWQTKLNDEGQVVRPHGEDDFSSTDGEDNQQDNERRDATVEFGDSDVESNDWGDIPEDDDESAASTIDIDSSEDSYADNRRRRIRDLNILAGLMNADDDEDFDAEVELESGSPSDTDSSMQGVDEEDVEEDSSESMNSPSEIFGYFGRNRLDLALVGQSSDDDDEEVDPVNYEEENRNFFPIEKSSSDELYSESSESSDDSNDASYASEPSDDSDAQSDDGSADEDDSSDY